METRAFELAAGWLRESSATVCLTGAGISTESGIPDFRSRNGIWSRFDPKDFDIRRWLGSEEVRRRYWAAAREGWRLVSGAEPSPGHGALARLDGAGRLSLLVTQNTDGLHQKAGHAPGRIVEMHGTSHACVCVGCGGKVPRPEVQARVEAGEEIPRCRGCGEPLKPDAVFFGQPIPPERLERAVAGADAAEVFLVVGSSLAVRPAGALPERALLRGGRLIIVNEGPTRLDAHAHALLRGRAGDILPTLAGAALG
ncbi:MAG: Sir2 family NAD-dependent protein deacetylase [Candidatus Tectomicrobia bacterium]|uniref:protein acetyllysine N-acetyltransferase n=1 Tax=Tectimicrobiota bacterium TaxID=2528274 RepID=A0A932I1N3_UNCTE|nr:Sir2 family NAD-dependent protein deacetylase [Candidatus Tectomicrobia bacterium]